MRQFAVELHPGQAAIWNSPARFKVVAAGRRFGKSHLAAYALAIAAMLDVSKFSGKTLTSEAGVYYVAPTQDMAKRIMWPKLRVALGYERTGGFIRRENTNDGWIEIITGRKIYIKGADNPDSLRGLGLSYVVLDEFADMKGMIWDEIVEPALMDYEGEALFIGTPKGKNHFYKMFMRGLEYNQEEAGDPYPMYESFHFKSTDNPYLKERELDRMLRNDDRPIEVVRQEIEASFVSGGGKVLKPEWFKIIDPGLGSKNSSQITHVGLPEGQIVVTVDLAGFARQQGNRVVRTDESVIATTLISPEGWVVLNIEHGHWDVRETALRIIKACDRHVGCRLGIEKGALANAVQPYLEDYMRQFNRYVTVTPLAHGNTKKVDRISWALQGRGERGKIRLLKGEWNQWFLDQVADFPDPLAHDDGIDAVAYADQMAQVGYISDADIDEWEPLDLEAGY